MINSESPSRPIVLVFANQSIDDSPYHEWCQSNDYDLQIICDWEHAKGYDRVLATQPFDNYRSDEPQLWAETYLQSHKVIAILSRAEIDVYRCARLREKFDIPGHLPTSIEAYRDKYLMKNTVAGGSLACPEFEVINTEHDLQIFCQRVGFPVVSKPIDASGGVGIVVLHNETQLHAEWEKQVTPGMLAESFVSGPMYHTDGLTLQGNLEFIHVSEYFNSCLSWQEGDSVGSIGVSKDEPFHSLLVEATRQVISKMPTLDKMVFHCEFFIDNTGQPVFCEIACRTGGARIVSQIDLQTGINLDKVWARWQCGLHSEPQEVPSALLYGHILIPPENGRLVVPPPIKQATWIHEHIDLAVSQKMYHGGTKSGAYLQSYLVSGKDKQTIEHRFKELIAHVKQFSEWETSHQTSYKTTQQLSSHHLLKSAKENLRVEEISAEQTRPLRHTVLRPKQPLKSTLYDADELGTTCHLGIQYQDRIIATLSLFREDHKTFGEQGWRIRGMAVDENMRRQGLGSTLLKACTEQCLKKGGQYLWCNARVNSKNVYQHLGFLTYGQEYEIKNIGPHILMAMALE